MSTDIEKRIQALQAELDELRAQKDRARKERAALDEVYKRFKAQLKDAGLSFDAFVRFALKDIQRSLGQMQTDAAPGEKPVKHKAAKKKAARKPRAGKSTRVASGAIKIPAGKYGGIPPDTDAVYQVKEKGPRPKPVKAYAEEIGIEAFLERCRIGD